MKAVQQKSFSIFCFCLLSMLSASKSVADCNFSTARVNLDRGFWQCMLDCDVSITHTFTCLPSMRRSYCAPKCAGAQNQCSAIGNPIDISTGTKIQRETDYSTGGAFPLIVQRNYSSGPSQGGGQFGPNWSGFGEAKIRTVKNSGTWYVTVIRPNGERWRYQWNPVLDGTTTSTQQGMTAQLTALNFQGGQIYQLLFKDGSFEIYQLNLAQFEANNEYDSKLWWEENPAGLQKTYSYDQGSGLLESVSDDFGRSLSFTYVSDGSGRIASITVPGDKEFRYQYDSTNGNLTRVYFPDETSDPDDNPFKEYLYENSDFIHALTGIIDENGNRYATFGYNSDGHAVLTEHAGGAERIEVLEYSGGSITTGGLSNPSFQSVSDRIVRTANAAGKITEYRYTYSDINNGFNSRLAEVKGEATLNCIASNTTVSYDANGFKDKEKDGRGYITDYTYNTSGQEESRTEALQDVGGTPTPTEATRAIETDWYSSGLIQEIREPGKTTQYTYYSNNLINTKTEIDTTSHTLPYSTAGTSRTWTYSYTYHDPSAQRLISTQTEDGPRSDVPDINVRSFNSQGFLTQAVRRVSNDLSLSTQITQHTPEGLPLRLVDENNIVTTLTYTPRNWLETRTVATSKGNAVTRYFYDNAGQVTKIRLPNGVEVNYDYDNAHRLEAVYTNDNERLEYELDAFGNKRVERALTSSGDIRKLQRREFDDLGRLWKVIGVENQEVLKHDYDENNNLTGITDYQQRTLTQAFDGLNRLKSTTDRKDGLAEFTYNGQDQLTKVRDQNGLETIYVVDGFGRRIQQSSSDTGVTVYHYDLADNLVQMKDARNVVTNYTYDGLNRMTSASYPASPSENITYRFDETTTGGSQNYGRGHMTGITEANGNRVDWVFDQMGQIIQDSRVVGGQTYTTRYGHDLAGLLASITYPGGREVDYQIDSNGRVSTVRTRKAAGTAWSNLASTIQYEPFGPAKSFAYGNGVIQSNAHDLHYRPFTLQAMNGTTPVQGLEYGFNLNNELNSITNLVQAARNQTFLYDANNHLEQATGSYGVFDFGYDGVGNRLSLEGDAFSESYVYPIDSHRLGSVTATGSGGQNRSFVYSNAGNIAGDGTYTLDYNHRNRLIGVKQGETSVVDYGLNALGQRVSKSVTGVTTHFHYGLDNKLLAESSGAGVISRSYVYLNDQLIAIVGAAK